MSKHCCRIPLVVRPALGWAYNGREFISKRYVWYGWCTCISWKPIQSNCLKKKNLSVWKWRDTKIMTKWLMRNVRKLYCIQCKLVWRKFLICTLVTEITSTVFAFLFEVQFNALSGCKYMYNVNIWINMYLTWIENNTCIIEYMHYQPSH